MTPFAIVRIGSFALAGFLGVAGLWALSADLIAPRPGWFPGSQDAAARWSAHRSAARTAAAIGMVRGDLWSVAGLAHAAPLLDPQTIGRDGTVSTSAPLDTESALLMLRKAAGSSPHDARIWLALARLEADRAPPRSHAAEMLKLSYFTGTNDLALVPLRMAVAARLATDADLRSLFELEVQKVVSWHPELRPALAAAYRNAAPEGRKAIEAMLGQAEPALLESLKSGKPR